MVPAQILEIGDPPIDQDPSDTGLSGGAPHALEPFPHDGLDHDGGGPGLRWAVDRPVELLDLEDRAVVREDDLGLEALLNGRRPGDVALEPVVLLVRGPE